MRLIVISKLDERYWGSCDEIELAFKKVITYLSSSIDVKEISYENESFSSKVSEIKKEIGDRSNVKLYILSHNIDFNLFLEALVEYKEKVEIILPIYGDMTIQVNRWMRAHSLLVGWNVKLLVASTASKGQIERFVVNKDQIYISKHPLLEKYFSKAKVIQDKSVVKFLYAGRISLSKNVLTMMSDFLAATKIRDGIELNIYGDFDVIGHRFLCIIPQEEEIKKCFLEIVKQSRGAIKYHGHLESNKMKDVYTHNDYFVSMSTYQDEDYGLAVAQAIASGCHPIITSWGGYRDFKVSTQLEVKMNPYYRFEYDRKKLLKEFCSVEKVDSSTLLDYSDKNFHPKVIANNLLSILSKDPSEYKGQSGSFIEYYKHFKMKAGRPYRDIEKDSDVVKLYKSVYHSYYE